MKRLDWLKVSGIKFMFVSIGKQSESSFNKQPEAEGYVSSEAVVI